MGDSMNNKGFTLVELLGVIVVLAIVISVAFFSVNKIREDELRRIVEVKIGQIEQAAILYSQDNPSILTESCVVDDVYYDNYCKVLTVRELINAGGNYFESGTLTQDESGNYEDLINDWTGKSMLDDTVQVYRKNNRIYSVMLEVKSNS